MGKKPSSTFLSAQTYSKLLYTYLICSILLILKDSLLALVHTLLWFMDSNQTTSQLSLY